MAAEETKDASQQLARVGSLLLETVHWAATLSILFYGVALVPSRMDAVFSSFPLWGALQVAALVVLWAIFQVKGEKFDIFSWSSPRALCFCFVAGMAWVSLCDVAAGCGLSLPWFARIVPCAACMAVVTPLAMVHIVQYCRTTSEAQFASTAVVGAVVAALVVYYPLAGSPLVALALGCLIVLVWYATDRVISPARADVQTPAASSRFSIGSVLVGALALFLGGGMACPIVLNPIMVAQPTFPDGYAVGQCVLVVAALVLGSRLQKGVPPASRAVTLVGAVGYCLVALGPGYGSGFVAALVLTAFLANASLFFYTLSQALPHIDGASQRFWAGTVAVFGAYFAGLAGAACLIFLSGNTNLFPPVALSLLCLLVFAYALGESWEPYRGQAVEPQKLPVVREEESSEGDSLAARCEDLASSAGLTAKEEEVLKLLARGWSVPMIARSLVVSQTTVRTHVKHLYMKLDVHSRDELITLLNS